jgi:geranylgeranyl pyrophosphate synthase
MLDARVRSVIESLPETANWPKLASVFKRAGGSPHPDWQLPLLACKAVGGSEELAIVGAAALACMQISIMLVDDMLDEDPRGEHVTQGYGPTANLAMAFQAAAFRVIDIEQIGVQQAAKISTCLAKASLRTAYGQYLDVQNLPGESNYWKVLQAKSTPFYGAAYQLGAYIGNASDEIADGLYRFGELIGQLIQIEDDLTDALARPANPDWRKGANNLLIVYALTAEHSQRDRFRTLLDHIGYDSSDRLIEAQDILIRSGAVSYAAYQLVVRYQRATLLLDQLRLPVPEPLLGMLASYADTLIKLFEITGIKITKVDLLQQPFNTVDSNREGGY